MSDPCGLPSCSAPAVVLHVTEDGPRHLRLAPRCSRHADPRQLVEPVRASRRVAT